MIKPQIITSKVNSKIKEVVKLRSRKERDSRKMFIVEGVRELSLALKSYFILREVFYCKKLLDGNKQYLVEEAFKKGAKGFEVNKDIFSKIAYGDRLEGILAIAEQKRVSPNELSLSNNPLIVAVESLEKPGNLGAILRTCDAAAVDALIVCDAVTDIYNPNCIRASLGAFFSIPVLEETSQNTISWLKKNNFKIFLAMPDGDTEYTKADFSGPSAIALGSEDKGLSKEWLNEKSTKINIPMRGRVDSLNVAIATSILVFEATRQRKAI